MTENKKYKSLEPDELMKRITNKESFYGSARFFENLGMHLVFDLISFQVKIVTYRQLPAPR
jgi:hypothetical protein